MKIQKLNAREELADLIPNRWYATHHFDRYPAKMIPQLARFVIEKYTRKGDNILDPFCGCGTSLIESRIAGRVSTGIEINPYAAILAHAKSHLYQNVLLETLINDVINSAKKIQKKLVITESWINYWFGSNTLIQLLSIRKSIDKKSKSISPSYAIALKAILAVTVRLSSKADPRSPKPFISKTSRKKRCNVNFNAYDIFLAQGRSFINSNMELKKYVSNGTHSRVRIICDDARKLATQKNTQKYDAIISSPPYLTAQDYYRSSKLELYILGLITNSNSELGSQIIGSERGKNNKKLVMPFFKRSKKLKLLNELDQRAAFNIDRYLNDMRDVIKGMYRHLKNNRKCCLIVGDSIIRGITIPTHEWIAKIALSEKFTLDEHYVDIVKSCRVPPQRNGHKSVIRKEHILVFRR